MSGSRPAPTRTESNALSFIVRLYGDGSDGLARFLGTGTLIAPDRVLTCAHVIVEPDPFGRPTGQSVSHLVAETPDGSRIPATKFVIDSAWDLAVLAVANPVAIEGPPLLRGVTAALEAKLRAFPLWVFGFAAAGPSVLWKHEISSRFVLSSYRENDEILTQLQWSGGIPAGCSGGPLLLSWAHHWIFVGLVYLGGERSATSRAVMADPIGEFLERHGVRDLHRVSCAHILNLPPTTAAEVLLAPPAPDSVFDHNPYRGLAAFDETDAPTFFGREKEIKDLAAAVSSNSLVMLIGASGSGKSSLVQAGLLPSLRARGRWHVVSIRPRDDPFAALAAALAPLVDPGHDPLQRRQALYNDLLARRHTIAEMAAVITKGSAYRLLLVIDPLEELFTVVPADHRERQFMSDLVSLAEADIFCAVLVVLRADFLGRALSTGALARHLARCPKTILAPMEPAALRSVIEGPAHQRGVGLEPGLANRVLCDIGEEPGALSLLQFTLAQLWQRREGALLTHQGYEAIGGYAQALAQYADQVADGFVEEEATLRRVLVQLVRPGDGTGDTRRAASRAQLGDDAWPLVARLADARLVVTAQSEGGFETAELVHEVLIHHWDRLRQWIEESRQVRIWQEQLRDALEQWRVRKQDPDLLLRGSRLIEARAWLEAKNGMLAPDERAYIEASFQHEQRVAQRHRRTQVAIIAGLAFGFIVAAALSVWAVLERDVAQRAFKEAQAQRVAAEQAKSEAELQRDRDLARRLATEARLALAKSPADLTRAALLSIESLRRHRTLEGYLGWSEVMRLVPARPLRLPHQDEVAQIAFSSDGRYLASSGWDGRVALWDPNTGERLLELTHPGRINAMALSRDGRRLATISSDQIARIWVFPSGTEVMRLQHPEPLAAVAYDPSDQRLATVTVAGVVRLWDAESGAELARFDHGGTVATIIFSPDGALLASAGEDGSVGLWEVETGLLRRRLHHSAAVWSVAFSPDGALLASAGDDRTARIWDVASGTERQRLIHQDKVWSVSFARDQHRLVTASADGTARVWNTARGNEVVRMVHNAGVLAARFSSDDRMVATAGADKTARLWDAATGEEMWRLPHGGVVRDIRFAPQGNHVATRSADHAAWLWQEVLSQPSRSTALAQDDDTAARLHLDGPAAAVAFAPDGRRLATGDKGNTARLWDVAEGRETARLDHQGPVLSLRFSPDGSRLATGSRDGTARIWDVESAMELVRLPHGGPVWALTFSGDGTKLATAGLDKTVHVWDVASGDELSQISLPEVVWAVSLNRDGTWLATGSALSGEVSLWDVANGERHLELLHDKGAWDVAFGPKPGQLATAGLNDVRLWEVPSGRLVTHLFHDSVVATVVFSPDGDHLATGSWDRSARVWDLAEEQEIARFQEDGEVGSLAFVAEGSRLATASFRQHGQLNELLRWQQQNPEASDLILTAPSNAADVAHPSSGAQESAHVQLRLWRTDDLVAKSCARLPHNLSLKDWQTVLPEEPYRATCLNLPAATNPK